MKTFLSRHSLDVTGFWVSAACGLHCVAMPMLVSFALIGLSAKQHASIEQVALGLSAGLGFASLLPSFFRHHRNIKPLFILFAGVLSMTASHFLDTMEVVLSAGGAALVAGAHIINFRLCKKYHQSK
jgi:MerC mercury resistance protein